MVFDSAQADSVKRSITPYSNDSLGVVTFTGTSNNLEGDSDTENRAQNPNWVNVGMLGHVYTKVSSENGPIHVGDPLTTSGTIGVAMKATKSGRIIGHALEDYDGTPKNDKPPWFYWARPGPNIIVAMIQPGWYEENGAAPETLDGIRITSDMGAGPPQYGVTDSSGKSWDSVFVAKDAAFGTVKVGLLTADRIKANSIDGLDVLTNQVNNLSTLYNSLAAASSSATPAGSDAVSGPAINGDLSPSVSSTFNGPALFSELVTFIKDLIVQGQVAINGSLKVLGDVIFGGHLTVNSDTAGVAVIPRSAMSVDVPFEKPFADPPIVTITLVLPEATDSAFLAEGVKTAVTNVTTSGFTIVLADPVPRDLTYNWFALAVTGGRRIVGKTIDGTSSTATLLVTPTPDILGATVTPSATLTPTPEASPSARLPAPERSDGGQATLTPTLTPVPTPTP
jgi:hypothetical protein